MARLGSLLAILALAACGPLGPIPGGKLAGELVSAPVVDWSFTDAISNIEIETRPEAPYSVTVWCFRSGSALYVPSRNPRSKAWVTQSTAQMSAAPAATDAILPMWVPVSFTLEKKRLFFASGATSARNAL